MSCRESGGVLRSVYRNTVTDEHFPTFGVNGVLEYLIYTWESPIFVGKITYFGRV